MADRRLLSLVIDIAQRKRRRTIIYSKGFVSVRQASVCARPLQLLSHSDGRHQGGKGLGKEHRGKSGSLLSLSAARANITISS